MGSQLKHARSSMKNKDHLSIIKENVKDLMKTPHQLILSPFNRLIWLEGWKSGRIKNGQMMEKWENKKDFNFPHFCLVGSGKMKEWKK